LIHPHWPRPRPTQTAPQEKNFQQTRQPGLEPGMRGGMAQPFGHLSAQTSRTAAEKAARGRAALAWPGDWCAGVRPPSAYRAMIALILGRRFGLVSLTSLTDAARHPPSCVVPDPAARHASSPQPPSGSNLEPVASCSAAAAVAQHRSQKLAIAVADSPGARKDPPTPRWTARSVDSQTSASARRAALHSIWPHTIGLGRLL
jgi:hypothetical protein